MKTYKEGLSTWPTPRGNPATYRYRMDTSDWNTINAIHGTNDEYRLPHDLTGWAIDVGGHIGGVGIALAIDNPELHVVIVEPVPDNARLTRTNILVNGLEKRVSLIEGAAGAREDKTTSIRFGHRGNESAEHHAFIGNSSMVYADAPLIEHESIEATCYSLWAIMTQFDMSEVAYLKIDCEGCEWHFLTDPLVRHIETIAGEWHPTGAHRRADILELLTPTHDVSTVVPNGVDPAVGPGNFWAVRRP